MNKSFVFLLSAGLLATLSARGVTLNECLQAALEGNPSLKAAAHRVEAASAAIDGARSGYYPSFGVAGSYTLTDNPPQAFFMDLNQRVASLEKDFNQPDDTDNVRGSLYFRMLLLDAGQRGLSTDMAESGHIAAESMTRAMQNELAFEVTRGYHGVRQASSMVTVSEQAVDSIEENLRVARARCDAGSALKTDVLNLEVQLAATREQLIRARNAERLAVAALNTAIGSERIASASDLRDEPEASPAPPPEQINPASYEARPELAAAEAQVQEASMQVRRIQGDAYPKVSAFGSVDVDSGDASDFEDSYLVGAMVEMDLFTGFRRRSDQAAAVARASEAQARRDHLRNQLALDLTRGLIAAQESWQRWQVAEKSLGSAEESLQITKARYEQGAADITELLASQVGRTESHSRSVVAKYDYLTALANLRRAQGQAVLPNLQPE